MWTDNYNGYVKNEGVCTYLKNEHGVLVYAGTHYSKDKALLEGLETCTGHRYVICIHMYLTLGALGSDASMYTIVNGSIGNFGSIGTYEVA